MDRPRLRHQPLNIFYFLKFQLEFLSVFKVPNHVKKMPSILLLLRQSVVFMRKLLSFSTKPSPKNSETIHFMFAGRFGVFQTGVEYGLRSTGGFFNQIKVCQQKWLNLWRRPNLWRPPEISLISVKPQQSLSLPIGALLKSRKHTTDHCCCPISAVILTISELEANLENQRLASVFYARESGGVARV